MTAHRPGFQLGPEYGPVVGVLLADRMTAIGFWRAMLDAGIVNVAVPPATPNGVSLLRCSLCAVHARRNSTHDRSHDQDRPPDGRAAA